MSKPGKILLLAGVLFYVVLYVFRLTYGGWHDSMWVPLVLGTLLLIAGVARDFRAIASFFTLRTTKHGLNMGAIILLALAGLICLNFLAVRYEKKFDWTSDKLNTLSEQSVSTAKNLRADTELLLLYRAEEQNGENIQKAIGDLAAMYRNHSTKIKFRAVNALKNPAAAKDFDYATGPFAFFAVQGAKKVKIDQPTEEGVTRALIKLGRDSKKVIYVTLGHGERDLESREAEGLSFFKDQLGVVYDVRTLTLYQSGNKVPADAAAVAIIGPHQQFLDAEIKALREYGRSGGRLFIAIDPGLKHGLAQLVKSFGVEFGNDFVLDLRSQMIEAGPATVLGTNFPAENEITKAFGEGTFAVFHIASSLKAAPDADAALKIMPLIATDDKSMATRELGQVAFKPNGPHNLGLTTEGLLDGEKIFAAVVFGDSDFLTNGFIQRNLNNDLATNAIASLTDDRDLISIRPKQAQGTSLEMTAQGFTGVVLGFLVPLPLLMFALGGFMWWRRRGA